MKKILIALLITFFCGIVLGQGTAIPPNIDPYWRDIVDKSDIETYGLDLSTGTWSSGVMNLDANSTIFANGARIIDFNDATFNFFAGSGTFNNDDGQYNVGIGYRAGYHNNTAGSSANGDGNLYIGYQSGYGTTNNYGYSNVAIGYQSMFENQTGYYNVTIGKYSLKNNRGGYRNFALGAESLFNNANGRANVAIGYDSLYRNLEDNNIGIGYQTGYNQQNGEYNVFIGGNSGIGSSPYTTFYNVCIGGLSGYSLADGSGSNIFLGYSAGYNQTTNSNLLIIDNQDRGNVTNEAEECLLYGTFAADPNTYPNQQTLKVNGVLSTSNIAHTLAAAATTFVATSNVMTITGDGGTNTVATITGANSGTLLTLIFVDGNITITDTDGHTANTVDLNGTATDFTSADDTVLQLVFDSVSWYEVSRSVN